MLRRTAAAYCDVSEAAFEREVAVGRLPQPVIFGGKEHWDRRAIEAAIDALTGGSVKDWRDDSPLYKNRSA
tara:strand:+ start:711 stop:923 length:213 start_codon:yes stop_codon:yes gene_type:complete